MGKLGLALAGGGARGAYQIGAWKALIELGLDKQIDAYSGASVGSLNAVLFAMDDYKNAEEVWLSLQKDTLFSHEEPILKRIFKEKFSILEKGIYNTEKLEELMDEHIKFDKITGKELYISTTRVGEGHGTFFDLFKTNYQHFFKKNSQIDYIDARTLKEPEFKKIVLASCAIPVAFRPITVNKQTYYDGGILENAPVKPLVEAGCTQIIVLDLFRFDFQRKKHIEGVEIINIHPKHSLRGVLDFKNEYIQRRFKMGYEDALNSLKDFKKEI